ncbi:MAG: cytochrome c [Desulfuromonadales bacterium]|nr:cytochrome c [Desulfuromonadales bacterium]
MVGLLIFTACGQPFDYPARQAPAGLLADLTQIDAGWQLFLEKCASCHGKPSEGRSPRAAFFTPPAPDFTEERYRTTAPDYLYWRIEVGKTVEPFRSQGSVMPAWGTLPEREIWQMVAYLKARAE